ncbi:MAG: hypothetical protein J0H65_04965 [Rhizobiales bacterium]|nr:hypothetical protein [Hyphomicrobiales bacterium]
MRHRSRKHAFEDALDEARLTPDDELEDFVGSAFASPMSAPAVGSLGDIAVAAGYVATASLARAYGNESEAGAPPAAEQPGEAARKLTATLAKGGLSSMDLRLMRRRFAAQNHPDRVAPELRAEAVEAMAEVNAEIDRALAKLG